MVHFAHNLRRLMAQFDLTVIDVAERTGLDERTVKSILSGSSAKPHAAHPAPIHARLGSGNERILPKPLHAGAQEV